MAKSKKVNKWEAAPESIRKLKEAINGTVDGLSMAGELADAEEWEQDLMDILGKVLDDYNKLEEENKKYETRAGGHEIQIRDLRKTLDDYMDATTELEETIADRDAQIDNLHKELKSKTVWANSYRNGLRELECRNTMLFEALDKAGIRPLFDNRAVKWLIQYTDKAENAFLAADQIKRDAEKRVEAADNKIKELEKKLKSAEDCYEVYRNSYERTADDICELMKFLEKGGIPVMYGNDATWYWDFENSAWDDTLIKDCKLIDKCRKLEEKIDKLVSALDKCHLNAQWDHENGKWCIYIQPSDTELTSVSFDLCEVIEGYEKLKKENKLLISEKESLKSKNRSWQVKYNNLQSVLNFKMHDGTPCGITNCPKVEMLTAERDGLNDYAEALKKKLNAIYGYRDTDNPCGICKNFYPKE